MAKNVYEKLARHLDNLPMGFPSTKSGVELSILRNLFTPEEAAFAPHLTLGRVKNFRARRALASLLEEHAGEDLGGFAASRVIFFRSDLLPSGPVYSVLKEIMLVHNK